MRCVLAGRLSMDSGEGDMEVGRTVFFFLHKVVWPCAFCVWDVPTHPRPPRPPSSLPPPPPPPSPGLWESPLLPLILLQDPPTPTAELRHTPPLRLGEMDTRTRTHVETGVQGAAGSSRHSVNTVTCFPLCDSHRSTPGFHSDFLFHGWEQLDYQVSKFKILNIVVYNTQRGRGLGWDRRGRQRARKRSSDIDRNVNVLSDGSTSVLPRL